ncbi:unnamed protein product [Effrenium voratum]|uniref:Uncharacterized protein n=1 Tax=Effrenium voratum TaxID=2562239 RepID=A0AA36NE13_9DINO|nr:unnamed protein product [Effrenium voratum]
MNGAIWFAAAALAAVLARGWVIAPALVTLALALLQRRLASELAESRGRKAKQEAANALEAAMCDKGAQLSASAAAAAAAEAWELQRACEALLLCIAWAQQEPWAVDGASVAKPRCASANYSAAFAESLAQSAQGMESGEAVHALTTRRMRRALTTPVIETEEVLQQCAGAQLENALSSALEGLQSAVAWWRS